MKRVWLFIVVLILSACNLSDDDILSSRIASDIIMNKELQLSSYNNFAWDSLLILHPYSDPKKIQSEKNIDLSNVSDDIKFDDGYNLLIFLKNKKAVKVCELRRNYGDFEGLYNEIIPKEKANFKLTGDLYPINPAKLKLK